MKERKIKSKLPSPTPITRQNCEKESAKAATSEKVLKGKKDFPTSIFVLVCICSGMSSFQ